MLELIIIKVMYIIYIIIYNLYNRNIHINLLINDINLY